MKLIRKQTLGSSVFAGLIMTFGVPAIADSTILRFSHGSSPNHFVHLGAERMAAALENTEGAVAMEIYPSHQLGDGRTVMEQITFGANMVTIANAGALAEYIPDYAVIQFPFLYSDVEEAMRLAQSSFYDEISGGFEEFNIKPLCVFNFGVRDVYSVSKPVRSPEDSAGMSYRVHSVTLFTEMVRHAFRASPTPMPLTEVYSALAQGVIDAAEGPPASMYDQRHYESAKYLSLTNHIVDLSTMIMSLDIWNQFDAEQQQVVQQAADEACDWMTETSNDGYEEAIANLEAEGVTVVRDVDREAFAAGAEDMLASFSDWSPGLLDRARAAIAD